MPQEVLAYKENLLAQLADETATASSDRPDMAASPPEPQSSPALGCLSENGRWRLAFKHGATSDIRITGFDTDSKKVFVLKDRKLFAAEPPKRQLQLLMNMAELGEPLDAQERMEIGWIANGGGYSVFPLTGGSIVVFSNDRDVKSQEILDRHDTDVTFGGFAQGAETFISADCAGTIHIWDWAKRRVKVSFRSLIRSIVSVSVTPAFDQLVVAAADGSFEVFRMSPPRSLGRGKADVSGEVSIWFAMDQRYLAAHDNCDRWDIIDIESLESVPDERWHEVVVLAKPDHAQRKFLFVTASGLGFAAEITATELDTETLDMFPPLEGAVTDFALSGDGRLAAFVQDHLDLYVWERLSPAEQQ
jgi:hypothetical protein